MLAIQGIVCDNTGRKHTTLPVNRIHLFATLLIGAGILAMGADNSSQLARCEASGHSTEFCRITVLGR
jgi:hypothetical protein